MPMLSETDSQPMGSMMDSNTDNGNDNDNNNDIENTHAESNNTIEPTPWGQHHLHGLPILETHLDEPQKIYWENYNTTTYLTLNSPYQFYLNCHLFLLLSSAFVLYPFVLILNNLQSNWYLPLLSIQASFTLISCLSFSIFINNVEDLYPNMSYTKMITGLFVFTILQVLFAIVFSVKRWLYPTDPVYSKSYYSQIPLDNLSSPTSTLYDDNDNDHNRNINSSDSFNLDNNENDDLPLPPNLAINKSSITNSRNMFLEKLSSFPIIIKLASTFGPVFTILHNLASWGLLFYFFILIPTGIACLNLLGKGPRVFNLLAHFIKGGVFFLLGVLSLTRYCGAFAGIGGAWNYAYIDKKHNNFNISNESSGNNGIGSGGSNSSNSFWLKIHKSLNLNLLCSFEFTESFLIFFYGSTNVFLEHLASTDGIWTAKDLQHVSIAFMYLGAGLCGLIAEYKLSNWRSSLYTKITGDNDISNKLISPGFSPNPFPVFTIFWTGILMSKHAQASQLSTEIHVQWGSLLTYGSFFRIITFFLMSYFPVDNHYQCYLPSKPLSELVTSFCLLCGGMVFMESTDQVIEALAYRGLTPMFTINVSVGVISLVMAWIMTIFLIKDKLKKSN